MKDGNLFCILCLKRWREICDSLYSKKKLKSVKYKYSYFTSHIIRKNKQTFFLIHSRKGHWVTFIFFVAFSFWYKCRFQARVYHLFFLSLSLFFLCFKILRNLKMSFFFTWLFLKKATFLLFTLLPFFISCGHLFAMWFFSCSCSFGKGLISILDPVK